MEILPGNRLAIQVPPDDELDDADVKMIREHKMMLMRWSLASIIEKQTGFPVEIAEWSGIVLPEPDAFWECRPDSVYQVVPEDLVPDDPAHSGFWALVYDHPPRLYRTPLRAAAGFQKAWNRHLHRSRSAMLARIGRVSPIATSDPYDIEERAAIMQYDGGLTRENAELAAGLLYDYLGVTLCR